MLLSFVTYPLVLFVNWFHFNYVIRSLTSSTILLTLVFEPPGGWFPPGLSGLAYLVTWVSGPSPVTSVNGARFKITFIHVSWPYLFLLVNFLTFSPLPSSYGFTHFLAMIDHTTH